MNFLPVVLWTDALFFLLVVVAGGMIFHVRRSEPLREAWSKVGRRAAGMASATILLVFLTLGVIDSLHYRAALPAAAGDAKVAYSSEVLSALDAVLASLRKQTEKTYSAPFATELYARETVELPGGGQARVYPRLAYGGAHLADPQADRARDIARRALAGAGVGLLVWGVIALAVTAALARRSGRSLANSAHALVRGRTVLAWRSALVTLGLLLVSVGVLVALAPYYHVFGTDKVGQDVLYLSLKSVRTALIIGTLTTLVMLPFAVALGILAGYLGGWVDDLIQYLYTVLSAIPGVLLIAAAVLMMQVVIDTHLQWFSTAAERADARLMALCMILGITSWTGLCRLLRGETLKLRELEYVQAARAFGVRTSAIMRRHVLPNVMHIVLIALVMDFSGLVLAEAVLSYVGIGVDPTTISFGTMINMARAELARDPMVWWSLLAAFVFMFVLVLSANLFADVVRDAFDPRRS
ncbi:ABC transporter permease [Azoarcus sp. KH32C]|uniref:ABC transporter permease n=1 Tax=Azoarcus sp. KH32C TaxID=748247 RepID=UPI00023864D6|nr:ABC transporter permease [Azoarcus sp. KH32C]BAL24154.1 oligopeptide transport system permease protein [Azoarcus sp. KH32C]